MELLKNNKPRYEDHFDLFERARVIRQFFAEYIRSNPLNVETQEKYGVISHSRTLATMTSKGVNAEGELIDFYWF